MTDPMQEGYTKQERFEAEFINSTGQFLDTMGKAFASEYNGVEDGLADAGFPELEPHMMGHLIMSWLGARTDYGELTREGKAAALDVAEVLGPDHAQALYRFAVLVTKLA